MKKYLFICMCLMMVSCNSVDQTEDSGQKTVYFELGGFTQILTRGTLAESEMTDLWLFDFVGTEAIQAVHITSDEQDFSAPSLSLTYGQHRICFVASCGYGPVLSETARTITWGTPRDTFWGDVNVNVSATSQANAVNVMLNRVTTKLRILITDVVPSGIVSVSATPSQWYYALDYEHGAASGVTEKERTVSIPLSYVGTYGQLAINFFGISDSGEWMTDVLVKAIGDGGAIIGQATIADAPFVCNRSSEYSGPLFGGTTGWNVSLNDTWDEAFTGTW